MMTRRPVRGEYYYGNKISDYGIKHGFVDYAALASSFQHVLSNDICTSSFIDDWDIVNGSYYDDDSDESCNNYKEIFQYYIISESGYRILSEDTDEIVFYSERMNMYVWGVTHLGTSWDYVLTDIPIDNGGD